MEKICNITFASSLTQICERNKAFDAGVLRICYSGVNRNGSCLSKDTIRRALPTLYNCPVVCSYDRQTDTLGGHDMEAVTDKDGGMRLVNLTQPVGVIPESSRVWFEDYQENDGTIHEYLYAEVLLWKRQEAYQKIKKDGITAHSMEITVKQGGTDTDGVYQIEDFAFTAFALIGAEPCFEASALTMFTQNEFRKQYSEMMQQVREAITQVDPLQKDDDKENKITGGGENGLETYATNTTAGIDPADTITTYSNDTVLDGTYITGWPAGSEAEHFTLTENLIGELRRILGQPTLLREWGECSRYSYADCDMELCEVYAWDGEDWMLYGFPYTLNGDSVEIDFNGRKRKKYVIADFNEGEQASPFAAAFQQAVNNYITAQENWQASDKRVREQDAELQTLRSYKADMEYAIGFAKREEILARFADLAGNDAFEALRTSSMDYTPEALEEKCYALRGRTAVPKFTAEAKAPKLKIQQAEYTQEPYGGLFEKYAAVSSR